MKLLSFKKTDDRGHRLDGNKYIISGIFGFIFFFCLIALFSWDLFYSLKISLGLMILVIPYVIIHDRVGKKKHNSIHQGKLFQDFLADGYKVENFGEYTGLLKIVDNWTVRIYYDWNKLAQGPLSFGDIVVEIPYEALVYDFENLEINSDKVKSLHKKHKKKEYNIRRYMSFNKMTTHYNFYSWTKAPKIIDEIRKSINILNSESLVAVNVLNIDDKLNELNKNGWYLPDMELVHVELEKTNANKN